MTIPYLKQDELLALLKANGWEVVSDKYWDSHKRLILGKGGHTFPFQLKEKGVYHFPFVVKTCQMLGIDPPEDHKVCYEQLKASRKSEKPKEQEEGE